MSKTVSLAAALEPPLTIDESMLAALEDLALAAAGRMPDVSMRLLYELGRATVVPPESMPDDVVTLGSLVSFRDETARKNYTVCLVLPAQADISFGRVSVLTPIGVALLGMRQGATIDWETRGGEVRRMKVLKVETPAGDADSPAPAAA